VALLSAALAGGCGGGDDRLSRAELGDAVGRLCVRYRTDAGGLPVRSTDPAGWERRLKAIERRLLSRLHALDPPRGDQEAFDAFIDAQEAVFGALERLRASGASGEGGSPPARRADRAVARAQRLAYRLGFDSCTLE
jgi:hypothetical protein